MFLPVRSPPRPATAPNRIGITGAFGTWSNHGIHADEVTIAELCKSRGYATAVFGKWHLGHQPSFLPTRHGFDEFYGLPYSNDMWPLHPDLVKLPPNSEKRKRGYPDLALYQGEEIVNPKVTPLELYDLASDIGEQHNVIDRHPDVVKCLQILAEKARDDLGDSLTQREGKNRRPPGEP